MLCLIPVSYTHLVLEMELPEDVRKRYEEIHEMILELPKYGNDIDEVDELAREAAYFYTCLLYTSISSKQTWRISSYTCNPETSQ